MDASNSPTRRTLYEICQHLTPWRRGGYLFHKFHVPARASKVGLSFVYHKEKLAQLFVSLHAPDGFRGSVLRPGGKGDILLDLWVAPDDASPGGLVGPLVAGEWTVQINVERLKEETDYHLVVFAEFDAVPEPVVVHYPEPHIVKAEAGWYHGELHAHSTESDGKFTVAEVVRAAQDLGLDFFSLTDHFTVSQWRKMAPLVNDRLALIRSSEITSHIGHANLQGIQKWVNVYVDQPGWSMNQAANETHAQGGLFCVNHAFSGDLAFRSFDFDWKKADLMEIYHNLEGCNNLPQLSWWDHLLLTGHRIVGVGGTDSHQPYEGNHAMGKLVTWVYADELSERGILDGLRRGRVCVSKGCEIRFSCAGNDGKIAEMWETISSASKPVTFSLKFKSVEKLRLFIIKDGLLFDNIELDNIPGEWSEITFSDQPSKRSYYRVELHQEFTHPDYPGVKWRDHTTFRAASNPIFVE
jgi:hypothetical protein